MRNLTIITGKPSEKRFKDDTLPKPPESHFIPWTKREMESSQIEVRIPVMPTPYRPNYKAWKADFEKGKINDLDSVLAHSAGSSFTERWLTENPQIFLASLALVAPWQDDGDKYGDFSKYTIDPGLSKRVGRMAIFVSAEDDDRILNRANHLFEIFPESDFFMLRGYGHFVDRDMQDKKDENGEYPFPELVDWLNES